MWTFKNVLNCCQLPNVLNILTTLASFHLLWDFINGISAYLYLFIFCIFLSDSKRVLCEQWLCKVARNMDQPESQSERHVYFYGKWPQLGPMTEYNPAFACQPRTTLQNPTVTCTTLFYCGNEIHLYPHNATEIRLYLHNPLKFAFIHTTPLKSAFRPHLPTQPH